MKLLNQSCEISGKLLNQNYEISGKLLNQSYEISGKLLIKGNNKITELRTILQRESPNS
jgi:hypothetical protein